MPASSHHRQLACDGYDPNSGDEPPLRIVCAEVGGPRALESEDEMPLRKRDVLFVSNHDPAFLQHAGDVFNAGVRQNFAVKIQSRAHALAGFLLQFCCIQRVSGDVFYLKRDIWFVQKPNDRG
jgi:hypothetical protein